LNEKAGFHHAARRRGGDCGVAAGGARAAADKPVIEFSSSTSPGGYQNYLIAFRKGLAELGYSKAETSLLSIAGRRVNSTACRHLPPTSFSERRRSLLPLASAQHSGQRRPVRRLPWFF
jgi:hypothetical protein